MLGNLHILNVFFCCIVFYLVCEVEGVGFMGGGGGWGGGVRPIPYYNIIICLQNETGLSHLNSRSSAYII